MLLGYLHRNSRGKEGDDRYNYRKIVTRMMVMNEYMLCGKERKREGEKGG